MKRSIYMGIITFITLCCIIIGVLRGGVLHVGRKNVHTEEINLDNYKKISMEGNLMEVSFIEGMKYSVHYECTEGIEPICSVDNDTLNITQKKKKMRFFGIGNQQCEVVIEIPQGTILEDIDMKLGVGEVTMKGIKNESTTLFINVGTIEIENSTLGDTKVDVDTGEITIAKSEFGNMEAQNDIGNIEISSTADLANYSFELESDIGEVSVKDEDYGKKYVNNTQSDHKIKATTNIGDVDVYY